MPAVSILKGQQRKKKRVEVVDSQDVLGDSKAGPSVSNGLEVGIIELYGNCTVVRAVDF